jgi:TolB protein
MKYLEAKSFLFSNLNKRESFMKSKGLILTRVLSACLFGASLLVTMQSWAEDPVRVEITGGTEQSYPIAVTPFKGQALIASADYNIAQIVRDDLSRSGRFNPMKESEMSPAKVAGELDLDYWRKVAQDFVVIGEVRAQGADMFQVDMRLINSLNNQELVARRWNGVSGNLLRTAAHQMSDAVYTAVTGRGGAFDTRMAYVKIERSAGKRKMFLLEVADSDGFAPRTILRSYMPLMSISWSPDATRLAYVTFENRKPEIIVQSLDGRLRQSVAAFDGINSAPVWSPDGKSLLMTLSKGGNPDIFVMDVASKRLTQVTFDSAIETEGTWSPDGQSIYFNSDRRGQPQVFKADLANPRDVKRITFEGKYNARPVASPDGRYLAYVRQDVGGFKVTTQDLISNESKVISSTGTDESPSFSPNSDMILYSFNDYRGGAIAVLSRNGRAFTKLNINGDVRDPAWGPLVSAQ